MNITIDQATILLNQVGISAVRMSDGLKIDAGPWENYYQLKNVEQTWIYALVNIDNTNIPYLSKEEWFSNESEGVSYFFNQVLSTYYNATTISQFIMKNGDLDFGSIDYTYDKLKQSLERAGIPLAEIFESNGKHSASLEITDVNDEESYIGIKINDVNFFKSRPFPKHIARVLAFRKGFLLYLLKSEILPLLESGRGNIIYDEEDYMNYLF